MRARTLPAKGLLLTALGAIVFQGVASSAVEYLPDAKEKSGGKIQATGVGGELDSEAVIRGLLRRPLTMGGAVRIALLNNRNLRATLEDIGIAKAAWVEAATLPNPALDLGLEYPMLGNMANRYVGQLSQNVISLAMRPLKKRIATENLEATKARVASEVVTLVCEVKKAYLGIQADQETLGSMQKIQEASDGQLELARRQREAGNITELALLEKQQQSQEGHVALSEEEILIATHREDLNALLGLDGDQTRWKITSSLPRDLPQDLSEKDLLKLAENQRLDLQAVYRETRLHAVTLKLTESFRWVPVLDFGVVGERDIDYAFNAGPSFRIELPIFNQGQSRLMRERSQLLRSVAKLQGLICSIRSEVRKDARKLFLLRERLRLYQSEILPTAGNITRASLDQYNAMQVSAYDLFKARSAEFSAQKEYQATLREFWITRVDLERAVGGYFEKNPIVGSAKETGKSPGHPGKS